MVLRMELINHPKGGPIAVACSQRIGMLCDTNGLETCLDSLRGNGTGLTTAAFDLAQYTYLEVAKQPGLERRRKRRRQAQVQMHPSVP